MEKVVKDLEIKAGIKISELIEEYEKSGAFMANHLAKACEIFYEMIKDEECFVFLSFTANLVSTGLRSVISRMIKEGFIDAIITTGGTFDHDIARSIGGKYYIGNFDMDDLQLHDNSIHRLGNILIPLNNYGPLIEKFVRLNIDGLIKEKKTLSPSELAFYFGSIIKDENSILRQSYLKNVPIYCPGIVDSSFGTALFFEAQIKKFSLDLFKDMKDLLDIVYTYKRTGALIIGGGISKHHTLWWNQFKDGLDYSVYITTAIEFDGSLSGARPKEAISWNKINPSSKNTFLICDASIVLPLMLCFVIEKLS
ncbi:MAG: deoxyhypusine synthase [Thermoproteota archaeon]|jgi:Deoxyhypusine synthase